MLFLSFIKLISVGSLINEFNETILLLGFMEKEDLTFL